ncbi:MAG: glycosyltransferase family 2 protein [Myxococcota bacterium]
MLRLDDLVVIALVGLVVASEVIRDVPGPHLPLVLAVTSASLYLAVGRRRAEGAPDPIPPRPAVLIPVKDNAATVGDVAARARRHGLPVYVVDDGSGDGSGDRARAAGATVLTHPRNLGKGAALLTGMRAAAKEGHTHVICLDADGQHDPDDLPAFVRAVEDEPVAVFCGVRDLGEAPGVSRFGRRFSNFWIRVETGWSVADSQCGFRAYPIAPVLALGLAGGRYELEVEVLTRLLWSGVPVRDLPCRVYYPADRVSSFRKLRDNARISWTNTLLVLERILWPPRWFPRIRTHERSRWTGASRGTAVGWRFVLALLRILGRRAAYAFTRILAAWYVLFAPGPRRNLAPWIARTMPGVSPLAGTFRVFRNFAEAIVDRLAYLERGPGAFRYEYEGVEHLVDAFAGREGAIVLSAHLGNIEVSGGPPGNAARMKKLHVIRFDAEGDQGRALAAQLPEAWRPHFIAVNRAEGFSALAVARALRDGGVVAMMGDRLVDDRAVTVELMGSPCRLPAGPWLLAAITRVPVIVAGCFKVGPDTYRVVAHPPRRVQFDRNKPRDEQLAAWAQTYADDLAAMARRWPDQWYNFHDVWAQK